MNARVALIAVVLAAFGVLTGYALLDVGYFGIIAAGLSNSGTMQISADLVIMCALGCVWMFFDARERQTNPWPFIALTVLAGGFGPLLYLLRREWGRE